MLSTSVTATARAFILIYSCFYLPIGIEARRQHTLTEDLYAYPKYRVSFLNALPVHNQTAERWLKYGLRGGEHEFLDQPWDESDTSQSTSPSILREIRGANDLELQSPGSQTPKVSLELMSLSPQRSYICLIPPPLEDPPEDNAETHAESTPLQSLSLLQPLSGTCLYHRQQWFTYSYCHNNQVRQFREAVHPHPHPPGGYVPQEDTQYEAFTLGQSPHVPTDGRELTTTQQAILSRTVEVSNNGGQQYLVEHWGDGTPCDKDGRPREIDVQFHCSPASPDTILFVKETKTCRYVMVINTPRLCSEPGFQIHLDEREEANIRCREVLPLHNDIGDVSATSVAERLETDHTLKEASRPLQNRIRDPILPPSVVFQGPGGTHQDHNLDEGRGGTEHGNTAEMIRRVLESMLTGNGVNGGENPPSGGHMRILNEDGQEEDVWIEVLDADELVVDGNLHQDELGNILAEALGSKLEETLRAAGFNVIGKKEDEEEDDDDAEEDSEKVRDGADQIPRDEL